MAYVLWQLGPMKLLIRCCYRNHVVDPHAPPGFRYVVARAKMEYQPQLGYEPRRTVQTLNPNP